jgi:hypothetical protein
MIASGIDNDNDQGVVKRGKETWLRESGWSGVWAAQ